MNAQKGFTLIELMIVIAINGFIWFVLLHFGIINEHQQKNCIDFKYCTTIFEEWGSTLISFICLIASFVFLYFYTSIIQKWRSLPE